MAVFTWEYWGRRPPATDYYEPLATTTLLDDPEVYLSNGELDPAFLPPTYIEGLSQPWNSEIFDGAATPLEIHVYCDFGADETYQSVKASISFQYPSGSLHPQYAKMFYSTDGVVYAQFGSDYTNHTAPGYKTVTFTHGSAITARYWKMELHSINKIYNGAGHVIQVAHWFIPPVVVTQRRRVRMF